MLAIRLTKYILWPASILYWGIIIAEYLTIHEMSNSLLEKKLASTLFNPNAITSPAENNINTDNMLGLFGQPEILVPISDTLPSNRPINTDPTGLQGIFIDNDKVWAIINNSNNKSSIVQPDQIRSFNRSSITIETQSGIRSLHLKLDKKGISIRAVNKVITTNTAITEQKTSRAELLRIKLLNQAKENIIKKAAK
jgi:hypothetical protein